MDRSINKHKDADLHSMQAATGSLIINYRTTTLRENIQTLPGLLFVTALVNLFLVSVVGILLRAFPFFSSFTWLFEF